MAGLTGVRRGFVVGGQQRNAVLLGPVRQAQRVFHTAGVLHLEKVNIFTLTNELWPSSQAPCSFGPVCQAQRICVLHAAGVLHHAWFNKSLQMNKAHSNARQQVGCTMLSSRFSQSRGCRNARGLQSGPSWNSSGRPRRIEEVCRESKLPAFCGSLRKQKLQNFSNGI